LSKLKRITKSTVFSAVREVYVRRQVAVIWDLEEDPDGNYVHIVVEHGVTQDEVDDVVSDPTNPTAESDSSGRPITFGPTRTERYIAVVWEHVLDDPYTIKPVTAYETPPPRADDRRRARKKRKRR
jgi:hypothetical protein